MSEFKTLDVSFALNNARTKFENLKTALQGCHTKCAELRENIEALEEAKRLKSPEIVKQFKEELERQELQVVKTSKNFDRQDKIIAGCLLLQNLTYQEKADLVDLGNWSGAWKNPSLYVGKLCANVHKILKDPDFILLMKDQRGDDPDGPIPRNTFAKKIVAKYPDHVPGIRMPP
jgi:hypothetical protein